MSEGILPHMPHIVPNRLPEKNGPARILQPERRQVVLRPLDLDSLLPDDHRARIVWEFVQRIDLSTVLDKIAAVEGHAGRPAIDPAILMTLWLFATIEGVGSARALDRLCTEHHAYMWICGGVSVNYHTLADFRVLHVEFLDLQLTQSVAALMSTGLVDLNRVAQDGIRVRASAGASSFRRKLTLEQCLVEAQEQVKLLRRELETEPGGANKREKAARERASSEREERIQEALKQLKDMEEKQTKQTKQSKQSKQSKKNGDKEPRSSTTDPDARVMKMGDGGFRPAFNGQFCTDTRTQVIVGVDVNNSGSDQGKLPPMLEQLLKRYERFPQDVLVDGGFVNKIDLATIHKLGTTVYAPVTKPKNGERDPHVSLPQDSPAVAEWRVRMGTDQAKTIYKERAATAECVNAIARNRGLQQFRVRGLAKVKAVLLWFSLAHNLMRAQTLKMVIT